MQFNLLDEKWIPVPYLNGRGEPPTSALGRRSLSDRATGQMASREICGGMMRAVGKATATMPPVVRHGRV